MLELAQVSKVEFCKEKDGANAIKICLKRDAEFESWKEKYAHDYIRQSAPSYVFERWFSMLGYQSSSFENFFNQDVFDLIGLRIQAKFEKEVIQLQNGNSFEKIKVSEIKPAPVGDLKPEPQPEPEQSMSAKLSMLDDDIPF